MEMLTLSHIAKRFGEKQVLRDVSFSVPEHTVFGFVGQNGAGKTTAMKLILGLLTSDSGEITVNGMRVHYGNTQTNRFVGYLPDVPEFYSYMTPAEYLRFCGKITGMPSKEIKGRCEELLRLVGLEKEDRRIKGFSRGMKQRLGIAQALFGRPKLLICDEPTSALDPAGRKELLDILVNAKEQTKQMKILTKLELCNLCGLNVLRFSRDKRAKKRSLGLLALWIILLAMLIFYVGGLTYGLIYSGLEETVPAYLITLSSALIFVFGVLKAGSVIFRKEGYDILCALPLSKGSVVVSRLLRMYVEDLLMALAVLLPGMAVYAWNLHPGAGFYLTGLLGLGSIPLIPIAASIFIGALITGISSRMRHKSLIAASLSILAVLGIMYGSSRLSAMDGGIDPEMLQNLSATVMALLGKVYPPAVWLGTAITREDILSGVLCAAVSLAVFAVVAAGVVLCFQKICESLYSSAAKHNYQMGVLKASTVLSSLCRREFRRYFSSSIYVTNTIIGPVMSCVLSGALLVTGPETLKKLLPLPIDVGQVAPFVIAGVFCMMTTTATSISMEGKNWWIIKSLPLSDKNILDAKILMNLLLLLPFYLLSELLLIFALKPGAGELLWLVLIPAAIILFSCVYGITINLRFPILEWESEVRVVKQSASSMLGGMGGFLLAILCAVAVGIVPKGYAVYLRAGICVVILAATAVLYRKNNLFDICGRI